VTTVVAVAPWLLPGEPTEQLTGCDVLLVHGTADRMTSPRASAAMAARLRWDGIRCSYIELVGEKHAMLRRARLWHELAAGFLVEALLTDSTGDTATQSMSDPAPNLLRRVSLGEDWITA
jgi:dienelactone hydrolase